VQGFLVDTLSRIAGHVPGAVILIAALAVVAYFIREWTRHRARWAFQLGGASIGMALVMLSLMLVWRQASTGLVIAAMWAGMVFGAAGVVLLAVSRASGQDPEELQGEWDPTVDVLRPNNRDATHRRLP
jgi:Na+/proline symporter